MTDRKPNGSLPKRAKAVKLEYYFLNLYCTFMTKSDINCPTHSRGTPANRKDQIRLRTYSGVFPDSPLAFLFIVHRNPRKSRLIRSHSRRHWLGDGCGSWTVHCRQYNDACRRYRPDKPHCRPVWQTVLRLPVAMMNSWMGESHCTPIHWIFAYETTHLFPWGGAGRARWNAFIWRFIVFLESGRRRRCQFDWRHVVTSRARFVTLSDNHRVAAARTDWPTSVVVSI